MTTEQQEQSNEDALGIPDTGSRYYEATLAGPTAILRLDTEPQVVASLTDSDRFQVMSVVLTWRPPASFDPSHIPPYPNRQQLQLVHGETVIASIPAQNMLTYATQQTRILQNTHFAEQLYTGGSIDLRADSPLVRVLRNAELDVQIWGIEHSQQGRIRDIASPDGSTPFTQIYSGAAQRLDFYGGAMYYVFPYGEGWLLTEDGSTNGMLATTEDAVLQYAYDMSLQQGDQIVQTSTVLE